MLKLKGLSIRIVLLFAICNLQSVICNPLFAQKILKDTMLHVVKSFQPTIADAYKINDMPVVKDSVPPVPQLNYNINPKKINTPFTVEPLKPAKMVGEPLTKLYNSLVKVGMGNYTSPYAEIFFNNLRSKDISYGAHLNHFSSQSTLDNTKSSGFSDNDVELYAKKFMRKQTLSGDLDYSRNLVHYYGYDTSLLKPKDGDLIKQRYSKFGGNVALESHYTDSVHMNYLLSLKAYTLTDLYGTAENNISAAADVSKYIEKQLFHFPLTIDYYNNKAADTTHSAIIGFSPYVIFSGDKWSTRLGMGMAMETNENEKSLFHFYPNIDFNYNVFNNIIIPYAGYTGGLKKNSLQTLTNENPFLVPGPNIKNTNEVWQVYGGLKGNISKNISYNARTSYSQLDDMYFFVNDNKDPLKKGFNTEYDNTTLWNVHGEMQFQYTEKIKFLAKADYNKYDMQTEDQPWQKPLWQATLSANYNLKNKIVVTADVFMYGKREAKIVSTDPLISVSTTQELKPIVDANLGLEYRYSKKLSGFVHFNNLGFSRYYYWNNYPTYKFNFLLGVTVVL